MDVRLRVLVIAILIIQHTWTLGPRWELGSFPGATWLIPDLPVSLRPFWGTEGTHSTVAGRAMKLVSSTPSRPGVSVLSGLPVLLGDNVGETYGLMLLILLTSASFEISSLMRGAARNPLNTSTGP